MSIRRNWKVCIFAGLMLAMCGCGRPNIIGTDAAVYSASQGKLYAVASQDLNSVYAATLKALQQLEIEVTEKAKDVFTAKVVAKAADGKKIKIWIEPGPNGTSELSIKAGTMGNQERARVIYNKIQQNLGYGLGMSK